MGSQWGSVREKGKYEKVERNLLLCRCCTESASVGRMVSLPCCTILLTEGWSLQGCHMLSMGRHFSQAIQSACPVRRLESGAYDSRRIDSIHAMPKRPCCIDKCAAYNLHNLHGQLSSMLHRCNETPMKVRGAVV